MNPHRSWLFLVLLFLTGLAHAQTKSKREIQKELWPDGTVKTVTVTRTTTARYVDLFNYYKKTEVKRTEFNEQGIRTRETVRVTKLGRNGKPCYEIYTSETQFDAQGRKARFESNRCDNSSSTLKVYDQGKLIFVRMHKHHRHS